MQQSDLKPAGSLIQKLGLKALLYGKPGVGKTPMINTAPRPVLLATEPGLLSMRGSTVPTWEAYTMERVEEFFKWLSESKEAANFDTVAIDSGSQIAELSLIKHQAKCKDGRKAYGEMSLECMKHFDTLYYMQQKHVIVICKETRAEVGKQVVQQNGAFVVESTYQAQPFFPGQDLNVKIPHRYDAILYAAHTQVPGVAQQVTALRSKGTAEILARDRSGQLAELEPPNLDAIIRKCMG